jgi:hypothetical protein
MSRVAGAPFSTGAGQGQHPHAKGFPVLDRLTDCDRLTDLGHVTPIGKDTVSHEIRPQAQGVR